MGDKRVFWVEENTLVINIVFAWEQAVAVTSVDENGMIASHRFPMYEAVERISDVNFLKYFFLTSKGKELLGIASPGGAGRNKTLGQKDFENLELLMPARVEEQVKISSCLSSIDNFILVQGKKVDGLKLHKKGLLQKILPALNEVSA
nr:restriction endonuclease subunit S [Pseudomonas aegrilactucae]